ncbi:methylaspartate mutase accessory protein GlmL [Proteinivorax hydrogeniformans]|uniref:Methylaspartate mutase accessory protein GlmL n=1 Tax=Proteinivorax hydrogeniformans TaxID=1826727 RepID=A0AAU8HW98_9FIRM
MLEAILLIDFGSTFTKVTAVDVKTKKLLATAKAPTTVATGIGNGLEEAIGNLEKKVESEIEYKRKLACSSAAGGLKMVAIGLVPDLTAEAAKTAALGAGAKLMDVFSYRLNNSEIDKLSKMSADIILLAGGTDGGNGEVILENAKKIAESEINCPIIVAGNKDVQDEINEIFTAAKKKFFITENVLPSLDKINIEPAREEIRKVFINNIISAKGFDVIRQDIDGIVMPTPEAVLQAGKFMSKQQLLGAEEIVIVDMGGATTDVHSFTDGMPNTAGVVYRGLPQPFSKRTVEGDLGMRYSLSSLIEEIGESRIRKDLPSLDLNKILEDIGENYWSANITWEFENYLARQGVNIAVKRHGGTVETVYTPQGASYIQYGKDLSGVDVVIGTGGPLVNSDKAGYILKGALYNPAEPMALMPQNSKYCIDKQYLLSSIGLLVDDYPDIAEELVKDNFDFIEGGN